MWLQAQKLGKVFYEIENIDDKNRNSMDLKSKNLFTSLYIYMCRHVRKIIRR